MPNKLQQKHIEFLHNVPLFKYSLIIKKTTDMKGKPDVYRFYFINFKNFRQEFKS